MFCHDGVLYDGFGLLGVLFGRLLQNGFPLLLCRRFLVNVIVFSLEGGRYPVTNRSFLGTWSMIQGAIYVMHGLSTEFSLKLWSLVMLSDEGSAMQGWFRGFGFCVSYIGLFYLFAGLADNKQFAAVSVFMLLALLVSAGTSAPSTGWLSACSSAGEGEGCRSPR